MARLDRLPRRPFTSGHRLAAAGQLKRIGPGRFHRVDAPAIDTVLLDAATRATKATICLTSALAHHALADAIPATTDLALPRGPSPAGDPRCYLAPVRRRHIRGGPQRDPD